MNGVLRHFRQFFGHIVTVFACDVLPRSDTSLEYHAAYDPNTDTPPSHIILTPGQPVLVLTILIMLSAERGSI